MEFCDECGNLMIPSTMDGKKVFKCRFCSATKPFSDDKIESYKLSQKIDHQVKDEVVSMKQMMDWKEENFTSTIKNFRCPRCGYTKAHLETRQTRRADEGMTHFITCLKCGKMKKIGS